MVAGGSSGAVSASICRCTRFPHPRGAQAVLSILHRWASKESLCNHLRARGAVAAAEIIARTSFPKFADWRWTTLAVACQALAGCVHTLAEQWDYKAFERSRDSATVRTANEAFAGNMWRRQFDFIQWLSSWLLGISSWVGGCPCHVPGDADAEGCSMKGRRLKQAWAFVSQELGRGLAEANAWTEATWNLGLPFCLQAQAAVRIAYRLGHDKYAWLDDIPYILARLDEPGVAQRALQQYSMHGEGAHHRVSRAVLGEGRPLRLAVQSVLPDGSNIVNWKSLNLLQ